MIFSQPDWAERMEAGDGPFDFDAIKSSLNKTRMSKVRKILNGFCIPDLPGQPSMQEKTGEWFFRIAETLAGGLLDIDTQLVQNVLLAIPKKNSKTSSSAALMLALMMMTPRPNSEFLLIGATKEISSTALKQAAGIIRADPELSAEFKVREHIYKIEHIPSGSWLQIKSFDASVVTGTKCAVCLVDEAHLLTQHYAPSVIGQITGAGAAIHELQVIYITTMSDKPASGWWRSELKKARAVRDGEIELPGYLPVIYEPGPADYKALEKLCLPELWERCNPNIGRSVSIEWLKNDFKRALATDEDEVRRWLSQHTNAEITGYSTNDDLWAGAAVWSNGATDMSFDWIVESCESVAFGFDGGGADDLTSLAVLGELDGCWYLAVRSWVEPIALVRRKNIASLLKDFEDQGDLKICSVGTEVIDIVPIILAAHNDGRLAGLGCDPNGIAGELADALANAGVEEEMLISVTQGFKLKPGYLALERRLKQSLLFHANQEILNWAVGNAAQDKNSGLVTKKLAGLGKIDPIVAAATAAMVLQEAPESVGSDISYWIG